MLSKTVAIIGQLLSVGRATIYQYLVLLGIPTSNSQKPAEAKRNFSPRRHENINLDRDIDQGYGFLVTTGRTHKASPKS